VDPHSEVGLVISTHAGYRFGKQQYMCDEGSPARDPARKGRWFGLTHGPAPAQRRNPQERKQRTVTLDGNPLAVIFKHIDKIDTRVTGGYEPDRASAHDFDGFIKRPTMGGAGDGGRPAVARGSARANATATRTPRRWLRGTRCGCSGRLWRGL
jgi:hypothetical protein